MNRAETGADADFVRIIEALHQLRIQHGAHPCYDAIEHAVTARSMELDARAEQIGQLRGTLRAVVAVASDGLL